MADAAARLDGLVAEAARAHPDRTAITAGERSLDFATLEEQVEAAAGALRGLLPEPGAAVAVSSVLDPDFAVAYYAAVRAGLVTAVVNPLLREEGLLHVLALCEARVALVDAGLYERLLPLRGKLPHLRHIVLIGPVTADAPVGVPTLAELAGGAHGGTVPGPGPGADDVACVQFTSGTTGLPKGVRLTHRNLTANAAQVAEAHLLDSRSVTVNHLPTYHPMHLNSALRAGATQVLCTAPDPVDAVHAANRAGATHLYSLPVRLARLATAPLPDGLALTSVRYVASGGSALAPQAARALTERFGVPVFQGYGLAETSPLTHSDDPEQPAHGSVGRTVRDTECRIVDTGTGEVLPQGASGEVQLRGPQVMKGYIGRADGSEVDADGWLTTGDVGRLDESGRLFVVDRLRDTFKCDNFLVAPSEIEQVAARHPWVRETVVVGLPDERHGAVAAAFVVLTEEGRRHAGEAARALVSYVAERVPYYQHVHHVELVDAVERSGNGKIQRRLLRDALLARLAAARTPEEAVAS
ncbi:MULTISPECIES: class I adenylate-forming enzyme family protein [Streptomyces]|uniref:AMP-dependent synthetase n=1 Tax=Streptomyces spororaveus TaxID=284039 RepID=A0ABQ3T9U0_9ACTN|nr:MULTISPECIES: AMP-binding protein [Streptomyces]MCX5302986.1 AMP-binding protein [Streptomyces sp. NBC_00160]GHI77146.1 AMP-dependent synthetase [Streptomyces spororaveus]